MNFTKPKLSAIATGVAIGVASMAAQAADQPTLPTAGAQAAAVFTGGATVNGGASYQSSVPAGDPADLVATIKPAAGDVGQTGSLIAVLEVPGIGFFNLLSGGIWVPLDLANPNLQPFATKTLGAEEEVTILDDLIGTDTNLTGMTLNAYVGYYVGDVGTLSYSATPASMAIAAPPAAGCPSNTSALENVDFKNKPVCVLTGRITADTHLTDNNSYLLDGAVFIGENTPGGDRTKLTIDAGTYVFGTTGLNFLVVDRNGQLYANGSREKPVIFTYEGDDTADATTSGQWGGLILNGNATLNVSGGTAEGEGSTGTYGGSDDTDSSGALTYVQVKYAGQNITPENELNGIAFQGTGSGTIVDYVQVHNNSDDGVEFFGGTTNAKHLLLSGNEDDALDWTFGWRGKAQFVAMKQNTISEHCIEADGNSDNNDALPRSNPSISNMTCVGDASAGSESGFRLREGTSAALSNVVIANLNDYSLDIDQTATFTAAGGSIGALNGTLTMTNSRLETGAIFSDSEGDLFAVGDWYGAQSGSDIGVTDLGGDSGLVNGTALNAIAPAVPSDPWFDQVDYIGAIKDETSDWTAGWTFSD